MKKVFFFLLFCLPLCLFSQAEEKKPYEFLPINTKRSSWEVRLGDKSLAKIEKSRFRYIWKITWANGQNGSLKPISNNPNRFFFSLNKVKYLLSLSESYQETRWIMKQQKPYKKTPYTVLAAADFSSWESQTPPFQFKLIKNTSQGTYSLEAPHFSPTLSAPQLILPVMALLYSENHMR